MRWFKRQRLDWIKKRLETVGHINRGDIVETFMVSVPQASYDLAAFQAEFPLAMKYNFSEKRYESTTKPIKPAWHPTMKVQIPDGATVDVDELIAPLVRIFSSIPDLKTIASCQGDPGAMTSGGRYGYVDFTYRKTWLACCSFCFAYLSPALLHLFDDVMVTVWQTDVDHIYASLKVRQEAIPKVTEAVQTMIQTALQFKLTARTKKDTVLP